MDFDEGQGDAKTVLHHLHKLPANTVRTPVCEEELLGVSCRVASRYVIFKIHKRIYIYIIFIYICQKKKLLFNMFNWKLAKPDLDMICTTYTFGSATEIP